MDVTFLVCNEEACTIHSVLVQCISAQTLWGRVKLRIKAGIVKALRLILR